MEKLGLLGEGIDFSEPQFDSSKNYSPKFQVNNGDLNLQTFNQGSMVSSNITHTTGISPEKLNEIIEIFRDNYKRLPNDLKDDIKEILDDVDSEKSPTKKQELLKKIAPMLNGISSSLMASFLFSLLQDL